MTVKANRVGSGLKVTCSQVCTIRRDRYLRVSPQNIWLTLANGYTDDVSVTANVQWKATVKS